MFLFGDFKSTEFLLLVMSLPITFYQCKPVGGDTNRGGEIYSYHSNRCWWGHQQPFVSTIPIIGTPIGVDG